MTTITPTRPRDLVLPALGTAVAVHLIVRLTYGSLPPFPFGAGIPLAVLGLAEAVGGAGLRARIRRRPGSRPVPPLVAARAVLVARASALAGAIVAGAWAGLLGYVAPRSADVAAAGGDTVAAAGGLLGAMVLVAGALWLQHCCRTPDDPGDERPDRPEAS